MEILAKVNAVKDSAGIDFFDLVRVYNGISDTVYVDRVHVYQKYKPFVVEKIYHTITQLLKSRQEIDLDSICQEL